jgi:hypothetical protein
MADLFLETVVETFLRAVRGTYRLGRKLIGGRHAEG